MIPGLLGSSKTLETEAQSLSSPQKDSGDLSSQKIPKRKLSVFHRSFDVVTSMNKTGERETVEVRRHSSNPFGQLEERSKETPQNKFVTNYRSIMETSESSNSSSPEDVNEVVKQIHKPGKTVGSSPIAMKLPQVTEDTILNNYNISADASFTDKSKESEKKLVVNFRSNYPAFGYNNLRSLSSIASSGNTENGKPRFSRSFPANSGPRNFSQTRLVPFYSTPRNNPSGRRSFGCKMSRDSSIGSDSEDDTIETDVRRSSGQNETETNEKSPIKKGPADSPTIEARNKTEIVAGLSAKQRKRLRVLGASKSLSDDDINDHDRSDCCKHGIREESQGAQFPAFPSLSDSRLRESGLSNLETSTLYRENLTEDELERKYIAFSIGLSSDRITLPRRLALSLHQRDLSERNLTSEVEKMKQEVQDLSSLFTEPDYLEGAKSVQHRLDVVARYAHKISCAAETLGAIHQEHRVSAAIFLADKYIQILRSRCENLAAELAETKRILLKNNIVIEENPGEQGDGLRTRYKSTGSRTMTVRRRASIATMSRPLANTQDVTKEGPRQRYSLSGTISLRRPSLCFEALKWEKKQLSWTDNSNAVGELRDIFEQTDPRSDSFENNEAPRTDDSFHASANGARPSGVRENEATTTKYKTKLDVVAASKIAGNDVKLRAKTIETLRTRNPVPWRPVFCCCILIVFLGFYVKHVISALLHARDNYSSKWWDDTDLWNLNGVI